MNENYFFYYIFKNFPNHTELVLDKNLTCFDEDKIFESMPEYNPSDKVVNKILREL